MLITHNIHTHTNVSPCGKRHSTVAAIVATAEEAGLELVGITDHLVYPPDEKNYDFDKVRADIKAVHTDITVLMGAEIDLKQPHTLAASQEFIDSLDYMIVPVNHYNEFFRTFPDDRTEEGYARHVLTSTEQAIDVGATVIAHPFVCIRNDFFYGNAPDLDRLFAGYDRDELRRVFGKAAARGTAFEINTRKELPEDFCAEIIEIAHEEGTKFAFGGDSHDPAHVGYGGPEAKAELEAKYARLGLREDDIMKEFSVRQLQQTF